MKTVSEKHEKRTENGNYIQTYYTSEEKTVYESLARCLAVRYLNKCDWI